MLNISNQFINLCRGLSPKGRAFRTPEPREEGGYYVSSSTGSFYVSSASGSRFVASTASSVSGGILYRLYRALGVVFQQFYNDANDIKYAQLPDNDYFTIDDANSWYRRLGLYNSGSLTLEQMKAGITQVMAFDNQLLRAQYYLYLQEQLQLAGFNVYVHENREYNGTRYVSYPPTHYNATVSPERAVYGGIRFGVTNYGATTGMDKVVSYIESAKDALFVVGLTYTNTFFIGGAVLGDYVDVPASREIEFRQLILKLKQAQNVAFLFVNYI